MFGIIKRSYKLNYISSLYEFANMVESSSTGVKKAQLVGTPDGTVIVPAYDWSSFLEQYFKRVPNIETYRHFRFSKDEPGRVYFKQSNSSPDEQSLMLLKNRAILPLASRLPAKVNPSGLSQERKQYLYREIRQFCKPGTEDLVTRKQAKERPPLLRTVPNMRNHFKVKALEKFFFSIFFSFVCCARHEIKQRKGRHCYELFRIIMRNHFKVKALKKFFFTFFSFVCCARHEIKQRKGRHCHELFRICEIISK